MNPRISTIAALEMIVLFCAGGLIPAQARNLTLSTAGGRALADAAGVPLPAGCAVRLGSFNLPAATRNQTLAQTKDYRQLAVWFKPVAENLAGGGAPLQAAGSVAGLVTNAFPADGDVFGTVAGVSTSFLPVGEQLYLWVFNGPTPQASTEWGIFTAPAWLTPPALGSQSISTAAASLQAIHGSLTGGALNLAAIPASYGNWTWQKFSASASAAEQQPTADSDGDGLFNLAEYAWGLNPSSADVAPSKLAPPSGTDGAHFTYDVPLNRPDVTVTAERSTDLKIWTPAESIVIATTATTETRRCTAAPGANCFWRVKFDQPTSP